MADSVVEAEERKCEFSLCFWLFHFVFLSALVSLLKIQTPTPRSSGGAHAGTKLTLWAPRINGVRSVKPAQDISDCWQALLAIVSLWCLDLIICHNKMPKVIFKKGTVRLLQNLVVLKVWDRCQVVRAVIPWEVSSSACCYSRINFIFVFWESLKNDMNNLWSSLAICVVLNLYWQLLPTHKLWLLLFNIILNSCCDYITFSKGRIKLLILKFPPFCVMKKKGFDFLFHLLCLSFRNSSVLKNNYREDIASLQIFEKVMAALWNTTLWVYSLLPHWHSMHSQT